MAAPCVFSLCLFAFLAVLLSARHAELGESEIASWNIAEMSQKEATVSYQYSLLYISALPLERTRKRGAVVKIPSAIFLRARERKRVFPAV